MDESSKNRRVTIRVAVIGAVALVATSVIAGIFDRGPEAWKELIHPEPPTPPRTLTVELPGGGLLPHSKIDVSVPGARTKPGESLWLAIQNLKGTTWRLSACTLDSVGDGSCDGVALGDTVDAPGPWTIAAVIVDSEGQQKIAEKEARHDGNLFEWLGEDLVAVGSATGHRR